MEKKSLVSYIYIGSPTQSQPLLEQKLEFNLMM